MVWVVSYAEQEVFIMSTPSISEHNSSAVGTDGDVQSADEHAIFGHVTLRDLFRPIEAIAFWSAITLPFLYLPLVLYGLETTQELTVFFALLGLNVVALVIGHRYQRE